MENRNQKFVIVLRQLRLNMKLTQASFAEKASIDEKYFGRIERGESSPTIKMFFKICEALDINPSEFMQIMEGIDKNRSNFTCKIK